MASRKTQQEIEKTFKKVGEGIASFEGIYEKIKTTQNLTQRDKLEDQLKREIKKLQRFRDQIKTWAAGNEVKDKSPLLEQRRAIETVRILPVHCCAVTLRLCDSATDPDFFFFFPSLFGNSAWNSSRPSKRR